jgi:hypothetical protein
MDSETREAPIEMASRYMDSNDNELMDSGTTEGGDAEADGTVAANVMDALHGLQRRRAHELRDDRGRVQRMSW